MRRSVRHALISIVAAIATFILGIVVQLITARASGWLSAVLAGPRLWVAAVAVGVLVLLLQRARDSRPKWIPLPPKTGGSVVNRPDEVNHVVRAVRRRSRGASGTTTALLGDGGFGKTTVAMLACNDHRILRRFSGGVLWVSVGRDARKEVLAEKVNNQIRSLGRSLGKEEHPTFTDASEAGKYLAAMMSEGPPRLLVLDDVWSSEQLNAFPVSGHRCARLVTTRIESLLEDDTDSVSVTVGQMTSQQAREVLTADLSGLSRPTVNELLRATGHWPLLLRLINRILLGEAKLHTSIEPAAQGLLKLLREGGVGQIDRASWEAGRPPDVDNPMQRWSVAATIEASTGLLAEADRDRFAELGVFARSETIPVTVVAKLWQVTGSLNELTTDTVCKRLDDLALVTLTPTGEGGELVIHDVIHDFLREELGESRLRKLHQSLLHAVAADLPSTKTAASADSRTKIIPWWTLPVSARYLWEHLIEHLLAADQPSNAEAVATDLRWVAARLEQSGPAGPFADLSLITTPRAIRQRRLLGQTAHLLAPIEPASSLLDILYSRVDHDPDWGRQARRLARRDLPALVNRGSLPDLPDPLLRYAMPGHTDEVAALAVAPDGGWLASGSLDGTVRIWDPGTGTRLHVLTGHAGAVHALAVAPDGGWLASGSDDGTVRIWDPDTGTRLRVLTGHAGAVDALAVAPDGGWLASGGRDGTVRIWDPGTGTRLHALTGHTDMVNALVTAPKGAKENWLASGSDDGTVRIWDPDTGTHRHTFAGRRDTNNIVWPVNALATAPDGSWIASGDLDGMVQILDPLTYGRIRAFATHPLGVHTIITVPDTAAPGKTWLATASQDHTVQLWDPSTGASRRTFTDNQTLAGQPVPVDALATAPDGSWLAIGGRDGRVRIIDPILEVSRHTFADRRTSEGRANAARVLTTAPDGSWLAIGSSDGTVQILDAPTIDSVGTSTGDTYWVEALAAAPDGSWLASGSINGEIRILAPATGTCRHSLTGHTNTVNALVAAPNGSWLASGSNDNAVRIWDPASGDCQYVLTWHTLGVRSLIALNHSSRLASAGGDKIIYIWDPADGTIDNVLTGHSNVIRALAAAPDGSWLASSSDDGTVRIWDPATGNCRYIYICIRNNTDMLTALINDRVVAMVAAPGGDWLGIGSADGTVRILNPDIGSTNGTPRILSPDSEACRHVLTGHAEGITALAVSPNGDWLASASEDCTVRIWNPMSGVCRHVLTAHTQSVTALAVSPNGDWLATASDDRTIRIWNPSTGKARAAMRVDSGLTSSLWLPDGCGIAVGGMGGVYLFDLLGASPGHQRGRRPAGPRPKLRPVR